MLPTIRDHAAAAFRHVNSEARKDAIQEAISNAVVVYTRLVQLNKVDLAYPTVLARYAVARIKSVRPLGGVASTNRGHDQPHIRRPDRGACGPGRLQGQSHTAYALSH
jgi:hypothetical protein